MRGKNLRLRLTITSYLITLLEEAGTKAILPLVIGGVSDVEGALDTTYLYLSKKKKKIPHIYNPILSSLQGF
jgi:hypothetical protein